MIEKFETLDELADRWQVPKSWLYSRTRQKGPDAIPKIMVGKYIRFDSQAVDNWLLKQNENQGAGIG